MKETTDIQQFESLFASWLEAGTSLEQEQQLLQLARRLLETDCAAPTRRDAELVRLAITPRPASADAAEFSDFIDSLTTKKRPRRKAWLLYASAAAVLALVVTVGFKTLQTPEPAPAPAPALKHVAAAPNHAVAKVEEPAKMVEQEKPAKSEKSEKPVMHTKTAKPDLAAKPQEPAELLEPREITDPQEAAEVLGMSCALLADCVQQAEAESQKALNTFAENISLVNEII